MNPYPRAPAWAHELRCVGVTGTNGKSSTTAFLSAALADHLGPVARVCTVDSALLDAHGIELRPPPREHEHFLDLMRSLRERGGRSAVIETTSATLALGFARAWPFEVGVFTNLGHDHQRTHGSFEHYLAAKAQLFLALPAGGTAVLNAGDPCSALIAEVLPQGVRALWFAGPGAALDRRVDLRVTRAHPSWAGLDLELELAPELGPLPPTLRLRTLPAFQAENAAAALLAGLALGVPGPALAAAIARCPALAGRFEAITVPGSDPEHHHPRVIVDYAHTPEALRAALDSARALHPRRVLLVVGAGGDADSSKRAPLGRVASSADLVYLTSDNPRHEPPETIAAQLRAGMGDTCEIHLELDRRAAISHAIEAAGDDDLVLIAGRGHEQHQEIAGRLEPLDDRQIAAQALAERF